LSSEEGKRWIGLLRRDEVKIGYEMKHIGLSRRHGKGQNEREKFENVELNKRCEYDGRRRERERMQQQDHSKGGQQGQQQDHSKKVWQQECSDESMASDEKQ